jgi:hypothetical protein
MSSRTTVGRGGEPIVSYTPGTGQREVAMICGSK